MTGYIAALFQHPIKGFTPQKVARAYLTSGAAFPGDRLFAVEDGPSGFDPENPAWISKQRFAVLAKVADVARARTHYDEASGRLTVTAPGMADFDGRLDEDGRRAFAEWLTVLLGRSAAGPLRVVVGAGHRFLDHPKGHVSIVNLASLRDFAQRLGQPVDPLRFRANLHVDGWPVWAENDWTGRDLRIGSELTIRIVCRTPRCAIPTLEHGDLPRDVAALRVPAAHNRVSPLDDWGPQPCAGVYAQVLRPGRVEVGDVARLA